MIKRILLLFLFLLLQTSGLAQKLSFSDSIHYIAEVFGTDSNNSGSNIQTLGLLVNNMTLQKGAHTLYSDLMLSYGGTPSADFVRDLQTFSNIEAGFLYGFYQFYYEYSKNDFWLKIGQQDINSDFLFPENGLIFSHSSFGIDPAATINMPAPTYPVSSFAITTKFNVLPKIDLQLGIFDGQFEDPNGKFLGLKTKIDKDEGLLFVAEAQVKWLNDRINSKIGSYYHSGLFSLLNESGEKRGYHAFYQINDIDIWKKEDRYLGAFTQMNISEEAVSNVYNYFGLGFIGENIISQNYTNSVGLALGWAELNSQYQRVVDEYNSYREIIFEANFRHRLNKWADLQYYFHYLGKQEIVDSKKDPIILAVRLYVDIESFRK